MSQNNEMIQFLTDEAYRQLKLSNAELLQMIRNIDAINRGFRDARLPSQSATQARNATQELERTQRAVENQRLAEIRLQQARERAFDRYEAQMAREGRERMNLTRINLEANRSYVLLRENYNRSVRALQDLIARGRQAGQSQRDFNRELRQAQNDFQRYHTRVVAADQAVRRFNYNVGNYPMQAARGIRDLIGAFGIVGGVSAFAMVANDVFKTIKEFQSLNAALLQVVGSQEKLSSTQSFLADISERFGLEIGGLTKQFTQFYVSAKDKISEQEIKNIFTSISKAGAAMGLSVDTQNRAFLALNQMMSKGTIQAEELRGQLGEALPGAFGIMAKAVGVTEQQLGEMMEKGELLAADVLPRFTAELEKAYGIENLNRVETLAAAQTRLGNAWSEFIVSLDNGGGVISRVLKTALDEFSLLLKTVRKLNETQDDSNKRRQSTFIQETKAQITGLDAEQEKQWRNELKRVKSTIPVLENQLETRKKILKQLKEAGAHSTSIEGAERGVKQAENELLLQRKIQNEITAIVNQAVIDRRKLIEDYTNKVIEVHKTAQKEEVKAYANKQTNETLRKQLNELNKNTEAKKANNKTLKESKKLIEGTVAWYNDLIAQKIKERDETKTSTESYKEASKEIATLEERLKNLKDGLEAIKLISKGGLEFKTETPNLQAATAAVEKYKVSLQDLQPVISAAFDFGDTLFEREVSKYDTLINKSNEYYDVLLKNAESGSAQEIALLQEKEKAEEALQLKKREAERKQAIARKAFALVEIAINTAVGVTGALSNPATVPLVPFIIAQGALQAATVLAQPIPQYKDGTDYHKGGDAIVGDGGKHEVMVTPDGKQIITPDVPTIIKNMPKGTKVMPDANAFYQSFLLNFKQRNENTNNIEQAIERGFKKAKINNYMNLPKLDFGHQSFKNKGL